LINRRAGGDSGRPISTLRKHSSRASKAAGHSGETYSALRGWRPIPAAPLTLRFASPKAEPGDLPLLQQGKNSPDKAVSIGKNTDCVKVKNSEKKAASQRIARVGQWISTPSGGFSTLP